MLLILRDCWQFAFQNVFFFHIFDPSLFFDIYRHDQVQVLVARHDAVTNLYVFSLGKQYNRIRFHKRV